MKAVALAVAQLAVYVGLEVLLIFTLRVCRDIHVLKSYLILIGAM